MRKQVTQAQLNNIKRRMERTRRLLMIKNYFAAKGQQHISQARASTTRNNKRRHLQSVLSKKEKMDRASKAAQREAEMVATLMSALY